MCFIMLHSKSKINACVIVDISYFSKCNTCYIGLNRLFERIFGKLVYVMLLSLKGIVYFVVYFVDLVTSMLFYVAFESLN